MKTWFAGLMLLMCASFLPAHAMINLQCSTYTVTYPDASGEMVTEPGSYCWWEWSPDPYDPPYIPPIIPTPPGKPEVPSPDMCQVTLDTWPTGCSKIKKPTVQVNGCAFSPDNILGANITPACNNHDTCYSTFGESKSGCDGALKVDIKRSCNSYFRPRILAARRDKSRAGMMHYDALIQNQSTCMGMASIYATVVSNVNAANYYSPGQKIGKCIKAHADRDKYCGA